MVERYHAERPAISELFAAALGEETRVREAHLSHWQSPPQAIDILP
jgi:hypothetical protein